MLTLRRSLRSRVGPVVRLLPLMSTAVMAVM
jgi:hypothetical protein